jgi:signal transduction histidine kinase
LGVTGSSCKRRIRELDEIKVQAFANVSHELCTPLALMLDPAERFKQADEGCTRYLI